MLITPAGFEIFFKEFGQPAETLDLPPLPTTNPKKEMFEAMRDRIELGMFLCLRYRYKMTHNGSRLCAVAELTNWPSSPKHFRFSRSQVGSGTRALDYCLCFHHQPRQTQHAHFTHCAFLMISHPSYSISCWSRVPRSYFKVGIYILYGL